MVNSASAFNSIPGISAIEETLWLMSQQSRVLQELRKDIRRVWDDAAARDINGRYLNSHEQDDDHIRTALFEQKELLEQADRKLEVAEDLARQIDECAAVVAEKLRFATQDMDNAYSHYDLYIQYNADARSKFPHVQELINYANNACD